jgi:NADPH-dependent glutamate synthase beta subunit-like oxidoreductase
LAAAFYLALLGHQVAVYESNSEPGGMLRYAIPEYRLPRTVIQREVELIRRLGVEFHCGVTVGTDISLNDLDNVYNAVFLAIGTWREASVNLPGSELEGVTSALQFLESVANGEALRLGRKVAVVGGGNAAIDSARTALRLGAEVTVIYRRERKDMPAIREETDDAAAEGAKFVFLATPHRIVSDAEGAVKGIEVVTTRLGEFDASGRRRPVPTEEIRRLECDTVILAVGEAVDLDFARASGLRFKEGGGTFEVDRYTLETSRSKFYAGGDAVSGAFNVSNAMGFGKKAARTIDLRLMGPGRWEKIGAQFSYRSEVPEQPSASPRHKAAEAPALERVESFSETVLGLSAEEALEEAARCLRCDVHEHH